MANLSVNSSLIPIEPPKIFLFSELKLSKWNPSFISVAKTAVENHGGEIFLENSDLGGLKVRIVLPI